MPSAASYSLPAVPRNVPRARDLILRWGWNATAYQILNPGIAHWFDDENDALIGYVLRRRVRVVAGAPVCAGEHLAHVLQKFESEARLHGERVCYFGAAGRLIALLGDAPGYSTVILGAQPTWKPAEWPATIAACASLRAQINRAQNKGIRVVEWSAETAQNHPALHQLLREWLQTRTLPTLRFLVETDTLGYLRDRRVFVATQADGTPIGFVTASPVPVRAGWIIEQFVRGKAAPNGTIEQMIDFALRALARSGAQYVTLGLSPLSRRAGILPHDNPLWLRLVLTWVRAHGRRFYNFDGLDQFKAKFQPHDWEPIYALSNERHFSPATLYAIADAFSDGSPVRAVARGLIRAAGQEWNWLWRKRPAV